VVAGKRPPRQVGRQPFWHAALVPKFLDMLNRLDAPIAALRADDLRQVAASLYSTPPAMVERLKQVIIPKK
jgi:hypothetical protein